MRRILFSLLTLTAQLLPQSGRAAAQVVEDSIKVQGIVRHFKMYLPEDLPANAPLVFVLHGYGGRGNINTWMNGAADNHKFALCVPVGLVNTDGKNGWNVGYPWQKGWKVDDVKTMNEMAKFVQKKYNLSSQNTFLTGMSNGGEMCWQLAYTKKHAFRALASLAGLTMKWLYDERQPSTSHVPFLEVHGTKDHTSEWLGDPTGAGGWGPYMSTQLAIARLTAAHHCTEIEVDTICPKAHPIVRHRSTNPSTGMDVWLYQVVEAGHTTFTADMNTGEELWSFFSRYIK